MPQFPLLTFDKGDESFYTTGIKIERLVEKARQTTTNLSKIIRILREVALDEDDVDEDDVDEDAALVDELEEALGERSSFLIDDDDESDSSFYREIHFERGFEPVVIDLTNDNRKRDYAEIIDLTKSDDEEEEEEDNEKEDTNKRSRH